VLLVGANNERDYWQYSIGGYDGGARSTDATNILHVTYSSIVCDAAYATISITSQQQQQLQQQWLLSTCLQHCRFFSAAIRCPVKISRY